MVKKLILIVSLLFVYTFSTAQRIQDIFNGYLLPITHAGKSGDTLIFRGKFINAQGKYDGTELSLGDVVVAETDGQCYYMPIVDIDVKGAVITASMLDETSTLSTVPDGLAAIGRLTQQKALFPQIAGITSTLNSCIQNYNNAILDREEIPDTLTQAHTFSIGTAVRDSSGTWVKVYDYSRDVTVDAVVVDSISSTVFAVQYKGRFRLSNHGYTIGKQLYVQPNGTYSIADTSNHITYGYALDSIYIEIKNNIITTNLVNERSNWYPNVTYIQNDIRNYAGDLYKLTTSSSRNERPDTSSNWIQTTIDNPASSLDIEAVTYFIPEDSLSTKSVNVNDRLIIKENGKQFHIKSDSIQYYPIDGVRVVDKGSGKYAVLDLSEKREWESKGDFRSEVHFANLVDGEEITIAGQTYEFRYSPIYFDYLYVSGFGSANLALDTIPDPTGFFVDTIRLDAPKNAVLFSENINTTFLTPLGFQPHDLDTEEVIHNIDPGPRNTNTADAIKFSDGVDDLYRVYFNDNDFNPGDTVTFSFWYKGSDGAGVSEQLGGVAMSGTGASTITGTSTFVFTLDDTWRQYSQTFTIGSNYRWVASFQNFVAGDTLYLTDFQLSEGIEVAPYSRTYYDSRGDKDIAYLYRNDIIKNREIDLRNSFGTDRTQEITDGGEIIQAAINYASSGRRANKVLLPVGRTFLFKEPLVMDRGVSVIGGYDAYRTFNAAAPTENIYTIFKFDIQDTTRSCIEFIKDAGQTAIDNCNLENLYITTTDSTQVLNMVYSEELNSSLIKNLVITSSNSAYVKYASWHFDIPVSSDSHYNTFQSIIFGGTSPNGLVYEGGSANEFNQVGSARDTGFVIQAGYFSGHKMSVEGADVGVYVGGTSSDPRVKIDGLYTESSAREGGPTILQDRGHLLIENTALQTKTNTDTLFSIRGGLSFTLRNAPELLYGYKVATPGTPITLDNVSTAFVPFYEDLVLNNPELKNWVTITGNSSTYSELGEFKQHLPRFYTENSRADSTMIDNPVISNTTTFASTRLEGIRENMLSNSDQIFSATTEDASLRLVIDSIAGPDGVVDAEVIVAKTDADFNSIAVNQTIPFEDMEIGWYTVSFAAKILAGGTGQTGFTVQCPAGDGASIIFINSPIGEWQRYSSSYYVDAVSFPRALTLRIEDFRAGDVIAITDIQLNKGKKELPYQATTTTGFRDTTVATTIGGNGTWNITGGLTNTDSLKWQIHTVTTASTVALNYPNNIISSTLNNGTFILDPSGFTGDNMIVKVNSFATDDVTIDASGSYNFTINGATQSTYDLLGDGAYAEFSFNSSLGTFELLNTSNAAGTIVDNTNLKVAMGADLQTYIQSADTAFLNARSTGPRYGGDLSDQGSGIVRIAAGSGGILDNTTPSDPDYYSLNWSQTDLDLSAVDDVYYIYVNNSGTVTSTTIAPSHGDYRTNIWLWRVSIRSGLVSGTTSIVQPVQQYGPQIWDVFKALGPTKSELVVEAASTNLTIAHTAGEVYIPGINFFNDPTNPHELEISATSPITFRHVDQDGDQGSDVTVLDVANYDNAGTITAIPGATTRAQIFTLKFFPGSNNYRFFYGQEWFDTVDDAYIALQDGTYAPTFPDAYNEAITLGWIIAQKGATNLADGTQLLITSNKFGAVGGAIVSVGIGDNDPANELQTMSLDSVTTAEGTTYTIDLTDGGGPFEFQNTVLSFQRTDPVSSSTTLTNSASDNLFVCTNAVASTQSHTVSTPSRDGTVMKVWTDASVSTTLTRSGGDLFLDTPGGSTSTTYVISGAGLAIFQYADGTWFKIN